MSILLDLVGALLGMVLELLLVLGRLLAGGLARLTGRRIEGYGADLMAQFLGAALILGIAWLLWRLW